MINQSTNTIKINQWVIRVRVPVGSGPHPVLVMLHGLTGDENSMWVFSGRVPEHCMLIAPRGLYPSSLGGYGWVPSFYQPEPRIEDFRPAIEGLNDLLTPAQFPGGEFKQIRLLGFSQGAALGFAYTFLQPDRVSSLAGLSGFIPDGTEPLAVARPLEGKPIFVAHGTLDDMVPVERSRQAVEILEKSGAKVIYCEDEVGHKLSASCFRSLGAFFGEPNN